MIVPTQWALKNTAHPKKLYEFRRVFTPSPWVVALQKSATASSLPRTAATTTTTPAF